MVLKEIVNDLVDDKTSLTSALLKTKVIAHKLGNQKLLDWINSELNGYGNEVPDWRTFW